MALNVTLDGYAYNGDGSLGNSNIAYQAYFHKVNGGSSSSTWNNTRIIEATGYWNINLGDGDWLTQDGSAAANDLIVVVFWSPSTSDRMDACSQLTEWSCFIIVLDGSSTYSNNVQVKPNICPNLSWSLPDNGLVNASVSTSNSSNDLHQWDFSGNTMHHRNTWYTTLMTVNSVDNTDYDWDDGNQTNDLPGAAESSHSWSSAGDYDVEIVIEDECGCTVTGTESIRVKYNAPVPNIICHQAVGNTITEPDTVVTFGYSGTDVDDRITSIDWIIHDDTNTSVVGSDEGDVISHDEGTGTSWYGHPASPGAFTDPGNHTVEIVVHWNDGFEDLEINYSEVFTQSRFTGPTVDFTQDPSLAVPGSPVGFTNTSTDVDRVGTGLPNGIKYSWEWTDDGNTESETDVAFSYEFEKTPVTADCQVTLCAEWSDGWDTNTTCETKDVVFDTVVTVTTDDCYYNLNIIGTSSDGSVTGYGWTVYSGTSISGSWEETWSSPVGIGQNDKKICFTSVGWYRIEGTVYGTGASTSDDEVMYVTTVCPAESVIYNLWNGTGIQDVGSDWDHSGQGTESSEAMRSGTNGLDATGLKNNNKINFRAPGPSSVRMSDYDFLRFWINVREWNNMSVQFKAIAGPNSDLLDLSEYIDSEKIDYWQRIRIPLDDFNFSQEAVYLKELIFKSIGKNGIWLDDIELVMGVADTVAIPVCSPEMTADHIGNKNQTGREVKPSMKAIMDIQPSARVVHTFPPPSNL
jgi:hypothetical protein